MGTKPNRVLLQCQLLHETRTAKLAIHWYLRKTCIDRPCCTHSQQSRCARLRVVMCTSTTAVLVLCIGKPMSGLALLERCLCVVVLSTLDVTYGTRVVGRRSNPCHTGGSQHWRFCFVCKTCSLQYLLYSSSIAVYQYVRTRRTLRTSTGVPGIV